MNRTSRKNLLVFAILPILVASVGSDIGGALDKILSVCLAIIAIIVILAALAFLWWIFGRGGQRG